jgi:hypothetical protein
MSKWTKCAALTATLTLGLAASAHAAVATFTFEDVTGGVTGSEARGTLVIKDYVPSGGTFVSWKFYDELGLVYELNSADFSFFSHNLQNEIVGSFETDSVVRIESSTSIFETGLENPNGVALLWSMSYSPVCDPGIPCGGGDGPQIDNGPPFLYKWTLDSLAASGAVPEPMTWVLMIGGFGAVGAQLRARRRRVA